MMGIDWEARPRQSGVVTTMSRVVEPVVNYGEWSLVS